MFKSTTALIPIAADCEEIELAGISDVLARGGVKITFAAVGGSETHFVKTQHGVEIQADKSINDCIDDHYDLIVLVGGPGAKHLRDSDALLHILRKHKADGKYLGAICAAVVEVLYHHALLDGCATTYPAYKEQLGKLYRDDRVIVSGKCVTSQGPGTALDMGLKLVELLRGEKKASQAARDLLVAA